MDVINAKRTVNVVVFTVRRVELLFVKIPRCWLLVRH